MAGFVTIAAIVYYSRPWTVPNSSNDVCTHLPDLILMDISLPGISGIEAMNILRNDPATAQIPVIALSANAMRSDIDKAMEAGFFRYLTKPIKINEFLVVLTDALEFVRTGSKP
jgi:CheY-like chemotaxis protein